MLHFAISVILLFIPLSLHAPAPTLSESQKSIDKTFASSCPAEKDDTYEVVEEIIVDADWADVRSEVGLQGATIQQVRALKDATDAAACQWFNNRYSHLNKTATWTDYGYRAGYYAIGNRYFAIFLREQPLAPDVFVTGWSMIFIHDSNMNRLGAYGG